jgi:hypothetical protein
MLLVMKKVQKTGRKLAHKKFPTYEQMIIDEVLDQLALADLIQRFSIE